MSAQALVLKCLGVIPLRLFHPLIFATIVVMTVAGLVYSALVIAGAGAQHPPQYYRAVDPDLLESYAGIVGVGHNSGDTVASARMALRHGADAVEIDVIAMNDRLYAGHSLPARSLSRRLYRGPTLAEVWKVAEDASVIKLDLKRSSSQDLQALLTFLSEHKDGREVVAASADPAVLRVFAQELPAVRRFLSVPNRQAFERLQDDPALVALLDGVTIHEALLDEATMGWLRARGLRVIAWTVNDIARLNALVRLGVDGITTDNLAILELLSDPQPVHVQIQRRPPLSRSALMP